MNRKIIRLFGVGGNFKTSIYNNPVFKDFIRVPEFNREFTSLLKPFNQFPTTVHNIHAKYIMLRTILQTTASLIMDRSLIDYAIMNIIIRDFLDDYYECTHDDLTIDYAMKLENELFSHENCNNVLLITKDEEFIDKIINKGKDQRAYFFDDSETYKKCQEFYCDIITERIPDVKVLTIESVSNPREVADCLAKQIYHELCI